MPFDRVSRRRFLGAAGAGFVLAGLPMGGLVRAASANGKINLAAVGVGGQGASDLQQLASHPNVHVAALCDVDANTLNAAKQRYPDARTFRDFRDMLHTMGDGIDAVLVATPDHMHAPVAMYAMMLDKHVYVEKPLGHTAYECRMLAHVAQQRNLVTQMGNQIHSHVAYRMARQFIRDGVIGKIKEVHCWVGGPGWPQGQTVPTTGPGDTVPDHLDWNLWLGVAEHRPYLHEVYHPFRWRGFRDFGGGMLGDFWCHIVDTPAKALELTYPYDVHCEIDGQTTEQQWANGMHVTCNYPGTDYTAGASIKVQWYDGKFKPDHSDWPLDEGQPLPGAGSMLIGEEGALLTPHIGGPQLLPRQKYLEHPRPRLEGVNHYHSFIDACLRRGETSSHFAYAGPLAEASCLGMIASFFPGQTMTWDAQRMLLVNNPQANQYLHKRYRDGWDIPLLSG